MMARASTVAEVKQTVIDLNELVRVGGKGSALRGLNLVADAFRLLLIQYANPNDQNPQGMCNDQEVFCGIFASIIAPPAKRGVRRAAIAKAEGKHS